MRDGGETLRLTVAITACWFLQAALGLRLNRRWRLASTLPTAPFGQMHSIDECRATSGSPVAEPLPIRHCSSVVPDCCSVLNQVFQKMVEGC